jgi:hypothetical protein
VTLALGELDQSFGDHPAYLALTQDGRPLDAPEFVVPTDRFGLRSIADVDRITVGVQSTEVGPSLATVLRAAHVHSDLDTWVAGVGDDAYVAVVTPGEQWVGERSLQISLNEDGTALAEPRLVVDGDVKGGRYVSDLVDLVVGHALSAGGPWWQ